jgi:hypothetical protein
MEKAVGSVQTEFGGTHLEDSKDHGEVRSPTGDHFLNAPCVQKSKDWTAPSLFSYLHLDLRYGPATNHSQQMKDSRAAFKSRCQLIDSLAHMLVEVFHLSSLDPPVKGIANTGTRQSKLYATHIVNHRILHAFHTTIHKHRQGNAP